MSGQRLLAVTTSREDGGAESHLRLTLAAAGERGWQVTVALPCEPGTAELWDELAAAGYRPRALPIGRQAASRVGSYAAVAGDAAVTLALIARTRPDAILLNLPTPEATPGAMLACALARIRTTAIFHLVRSDLRVKPARRRLYRLAARSGQRWVCVSEDNRATLARAFGVPAQRIAVVRNGVPMRPIPGERRQEIRAELGAGEGDTVVLSTGRLSEQKDHRVIIGALRALLEIEPGLIFAWAGDGPLRDALAAELDASGLAAHVRMLGHRSDVPALLAAADVFLLPSRDEGGAPPFALAEAMYAGVPVVVSDAGALTESVRDRENGLVFARGDCGELARVLGWALAHREDLGAMAASAHEQALREFTLQRMLDGLMAEVLPAPAGRSRQS